jgi:putative membrane protein
MKSKNEILKKTSLNVRYYTACIIVPVILTFTACENKMPVDTKDASAQNEIKSPEPKQADADFLIAAATINLEEIQLGKLAESNGTRQEVKDLGKMMEEGHTKAQKALEDLAVKKLVIVPTTITSTGEDAYKKLNEKSGADFDKEFCNMMVEGHKKAIDKFTQESTNGTDMDTKAWAESMLPDLKMHLDHSVDCQKLVGNKLNETVNK